MKYIRLITLISVALILGSCEEDFLETAPITEIETKDVFADEGNINQLLSGAYQPMRWEFNNAFGDSYCMTYIYTDVRSDDVILENKFFQPHSHGFEDFVNLSPSNINVQGIWAKLYAGVAKSNEVILGLLQVSDDVLDPSLKTAYLGEARFLRAFYYFDLVRNFGAVPLFGDAPIDLANSESVQRQSIELVYAQIESDLLEATNTLPTVQTEKYRATKGAALGLLSKVYLYQEKWQDAADAAQAVIDLGIYSLEENFEDNFKITNEFGKESLFEVSYTGDLSGGTWNPNAKASLSLQFFSPNFNPTVLQGWSYNLTTPELLAAFNSEGDTKRRDATIMLEGHEFDSEALSAAGFSPIPAGWFDTWINSAESNGLRYGDNFSYSLKYFLTPEEIESETPGLQQSTLNHKVMRYAEILLILAEATINGASGNGQAAFDEVRARAGLPSKPLTYDALKKERRLELATEYNRFHDLVRWGDAANELDNFTTGRDELLPIPLNDILLTGIGADGTAVLTQNPGY